MIFKNLFKVVVLFMLLHIIDDLTFCNYGTYNSYVPYCNCSNVLGNGPKCEIEKSVNNSDFLVIILCLPNESQLWRKNIEIQFPNESIEITEENKNYAKGIFKYISFEIYYFCVKFDKKWFLWPRQSEVMIKETITRLNYRISKPKDNESKFTGIQKLAFSHKDIPPKCKFGMHKQGGLIPYCDCTNVFGDGTYCEMNLNRSSHYKCLLCHIDKSEAWKKNLEDQFPKESITFTKENPKSVKGFIGNHISFKVYYFCEKTSKKIFLWPQQKSNQSLKNNSSYFENGTVHKYYETLNETRTEKASDDIKNDYSRYYIIFPILCLFFGLLLIVIFVIYKKTGGICNYFPKSKTQKKDPTAKKLQDNQDSNDYSSVAYLKC